MNKEQEFENYLSISPNKFGIYLIDKRSLRNLYKEELVINDNNKYIDLIEKFLDKNIFKIEKLVENLLKIYFSYLKIKNFKFRNRIKKIIRIYYKEYLENLLIELKDLYRENYPKQEIMHMIINKYYINYKVTYCLKRI